MHQVSEFEHILLDILRAILGRLPFGVVAAELAMKHPRPPCLSRPCVAAASDMLRKGAVEWWSRNGGWQTSRHLRGDQVRSGRVWERVAPEQPQLEFSGASIELLLWLASADTVHEAWLPSVKSAEFTGADYWLCLQAFRLLQLSPCAPNLAAQPGFAANPLLWLEFPEEVPKRIGGVPSWKRWLEPDRVWMFECLQDRWTKAWIALERRKGQFVQSKQLEDFADRQDRVLESFLPAIEQAGRRDLARFLMHTQAALLQPHTTVRDWILRLDLQDKKLADRQRIQWQSLNVMRLGAKWQEWQNWAQGTGYLDEGYAASQLWKHDFERLHGERLCESCQSLVKQADPLRK